MVLDPIVQRLHWSRKAGYSRVLLSLASVILGLIAIEVLVRLTGIDHSLMVKAVAFQGADVPVHQRSADAFLHYELKPGARARLVFPGKEPYTVSIDEFGARFPTHSATKAPGVFRILAFGGSTLFGAAVNDDETMAAVLERSLNAAGPGNMRFEVWNFGANAYTLGQAAYQARRKLRVLSPDLILVLDHNRNRRTFLLPESGRPEHYPHESFLTDPHFYQEQFYAPQFMPPDLHQTAMMYSAAYRAVVVAILLQMNLQHFVCCAKLNTDEARLLSREAAAQRVPVVYFAIPANRGGLGPQSVFPELPPDHYIDLYRPDADPLFYEVHPPAATLAEFATLLMQELKRRHFVPG